MRNRRRRTISGYGRFLIILVLLMISQACATKKHTMPPLAAVEGVERHFSEGRIVDVGKGKAIDFPDLIDNLGAADVVFVGEVHNNPEHHLLQVQLLQALAERYTPLAVAMEFFDKTRQPVLDRFMGGDLDEKEFLEQVDWEHAWRFPYRLYRPLLFTARDKATALLGINAPGPVVKKVARTGLESLTPEERKQMARDMDLDNAAHREYVSTVFKQHSVHKNVPGGMGNFDYFYQAQCVWEETMAEAVADYMAARGGKMVVFAGNGHIADRFGIPERVLRRMDLRIATIVLYPLTERTTINKRLADYVWLTGDGKTGRTMRRPGKMPPLRTDIKRKDMKNEN